MLRQTKPAERFAGGPGVRSGAGGGIEAEQLVFRGNRQGRDQLQQADRADMADHALFVQALHHHARELG